MFGEKNVAGIATTHHPLGDVDPRTGKIGTLIYIDDAANWPAVNSHPKLQARMFLERAADVHCALHWRFRTGVKYQRHAVARRDFKQATPGFGTLKLFGRADNLVQFLNRRVLIVNRKPRIPDNVDEQNMRDLQFDLFFDLGGHCSEANYNWCWHHLRSCAARRGDKIDKSLSQGRERERGATVTAAVSPAKEMLQGRG